jgi:sugar phosphate isomerase/epimerase
VQIVLNSKFFRALDIRALGDRARQLGFDGIDVMIRPGHPVHPGNIATALPEAVTVWADQGLTCPLASAPVTLVDPDAPEVECVYAGCAAAGVPRLKIGFFPFTPGADYWALVGTAREALAGFARLSERYGVQTVYQVHSGPLLGSNCAGLMHLLRGFDPVRLGAYPDLGHMVLDGEDYAMGLAMLGEHLSIVGVKDAYHAPRLAGSEPPFLPRFVPLGRGAVNWRRALGALRARGFDGAFSVHTEYEFDESIMRQVGYADATPPKLEEWAQSDAAYLRRMWDVSGCEAVTLQ